MLDSKQIENNTKMIEEIKASLAAMKMAIEDFISKDVTEEEKEKNIRIFNHLFLTNLNKTRGVDITTNLSIGRVILTKYNRTDKVERWEIHADIKSEG